MSVLSGPIMGTDYRISVVSNFEFDEKLIHQQVKATMNKVNDSMSHYLETSEISKINRSVAEKEIKVSNDLAIVLAEAQAISELSSGAFDITVAPVVNLWGFGPAGTITKEPAQAVIDSFSQSVGYQKITLQDNVLIKSNGGTQLNLSAIAKGFAIDQVARTLHENGIHDYLINIGGELKAGGHNVDNQVWRVGIEKPVMLGGVQQIIKLENQAVATSGDYLNFIIFDGKRYSHVIDPITLAPVLHRLALVSVVHENASSADALATAMLVMGEETAFEFAEQQSLAVYFVIRDAEGDGFYSRYSSNFERFINE